jgi:hypothetical protein
MMEKSKHALLFELQYAQRLCQRHQRMYGRVRMAFQFLTLLGAAGAVKGVIMSSPDWAGISGLILAAITVIDQVLDPAAKSAAYQEDYKRYTRVLRLARNMEAPEIQRELDVLHEDDEDEIEALRYAAYNDTVIQCGLDSSQNYRLSLWGKVVTAVA